MIVLEIYIFVLAAFTGYMVISRVPQRLHTPLMAATNAISGISLVGFGDHSGRGVQPPGHRHPCPSLHALRYAKPRKDKSIPAQHSDSTTTHYR